MAAALNNMYLSRHYNEGLSEKTMSKLKVRLVYRRNQKSVGSVIMRVSQLVQLVNEFGTQSIDLRSVPINSFHLPIIEQLWVRAQPSNCVFIFCKDAIDRISPEGCDLLRKRGSKVASDYIDKNISSLDFSKIDAHIASSHRQFSYLKAQKLPRGSVHLFLHQYDLRLWGRSPVKKHSNAFYFGESKNLAKAEELKGAVTSIPYRGVMTEQVIEEMLSYKYQYCVRPEQQADHSGVFKPATKVMNSIAMGIPPIVASYMSEEIRLLGPGYPFIIDGDRLKNAAEEKFLDFLDDERSYAMARDAMAQLQARFSPKSLAIQFEEMCKAIMTTCD